MLNVCRKHDAPGHEKQEAKGKSRLGASVETSSSHRHTYLHPLFTPLFPSSCPHALVLVFCFLLVVSGQDPGSHLVCFQHHPRTSPLSPFIPLHRFI